MSPRPSPLPLAMMALSAAVFAAGSMGMSIKAEPFHSWYYCFAWWPYIIMVESVLHLRGEEATLYERPARFFTLLPLSLGVWLVFEAFNFRLGNWGYVNLPSDQALRWGGYALSFATVIPGLFVTRRLLRALGLFQTVIVRGLERPGRLYPYLVSAGILCLALPLIWPLYFFPLVWGGFVFILDPLLHQAGEDCLLADLERGDLSRIVQLAVAGLLCGLLWEMWNFWAGSKWVYSVPFVGGIKLFEMPVPGFLGFPPFALECFVMSKAFFALKKRAWKRGPGTKVLFAAVSLIALLAICLLVMPGMDARTVLSFAN